MQQQKASKSVYTLSGVRAVVVVGVFAAVTAVLSQLSVPIGPVPISCSLLAVYVTGLLLPVKPAFLSQLVYLLLGVVGVPVFAGFQAGAARLAGPTGGYLLVYPVMAVLIAALMRVFDKRLAGKSLALRAAGISGILLLALLVCYAGGTAWFTIFSGGHFEEALTLTVLPFIVWDIAKIALCVVFTLAARERLKKVLRGKAAR